MNEKSILSVLLTNTLMVVIGMSLALQSCSSGKKNENYKDEDKYSEEMEDYSSETDEDMEDYEEPKFYKLDLTERGVIAENYEVDEVAATTIRGGDIKNMRTLSFEIYEPDTEVSSSFGFISYPAPEDMKIIPAEFKVKPFTGDPNGVLAQNEVYIMGAIDEENYQLGLKEGLLDKLTERFVLLDGEENKLNIKSATDTNSEKENEISSVSEYMVTGQQDVKGSFTLSFMEISTKKKFTLKADFEVIHDWGYLDEEKMKADLE